MHKDIRRVYAYGNVVQIENASNLFQNAGHHISKVIPTNHMEVVDVSLLSEKVCYFDVDGVSFTARSPNILGHGVMK